MTPRLLDALEICLQAMENGEALEAALARYPHLAKDLRPLLESAQAARTLRRRDISPNTVTRGRLRVLSAAARLRQTKAPSAFTARTWRLALAALAVVVFLALSGSGLLTVSARSLPGDTLYPLKRSVEKTQLTLASDPAQKVALQDEFRQRRVEETESLITNHRVEMVEFQGVVTAQTDDGWIVAGLPVVVTPQTQIRGTITVGIEVEVSGETRADGSIRANRLTAGDGIEGQEGTDLEGPSAEPVNPQGNDSEFNGSRTPEPTVSYEGDRGDRHQGTRMPEPTEFHWNDPGSTQPPEPTPSAFQNNGTPTPEPTEGSEGGHH